MAADAEHQWAPAQRMQQAPTQLAQPMQQQVLSQLGQRMQQAPSQLVHEIAARPMQGPKRFFVSDDSDDSDDSDVSDVSDDSDA